MKGEKTGGRQAGTPNRATAELKQLAKQYAPEAIKKLAILAGLHGTKGVAKQEAAQVSAIKEILDRGYGKAAQPLANDPDNPLMPTKEGVFQIAFVKSATKR